MRYLHDETASFIKTSHSDGDMIWAKAKDRVEFVLGHPNGWKGKPQQRYRESAVLGGLVPNTPFGRARVRMITEGEASALACLNGGLAPSPLVVREESAYVNDPTDPHYFSQDSDSSLRMRAEGRWMSVLSK